MGYWSKRLNNEDAMCKFDSDDYTSMIENAQREISGLNDHKEYHIRRISESSEQLTKCNERIEMYQRQIQVATAQLKKDESRSH